MNAKQIELKLGREVMAINSEERTIVLRDGKVQAYDKLVLATGAKPLIPAIAGLNKVKKRFFRYVRSLMLMEFEKRWEKIHSRKLQSSVQGTSVWRLRLP